MGCLTPIRRTFREIVRTNIRTDLIYGAGAINQKRAGIILTGVNPGFFIKKLAVGVGRLSPVNFLAEDIYLPETVLYFQYTVPPIREGTDKMGQFFIMLIKVIDDALALLQRCPDKLATAVGTAPGAGERHSGSGNFLNYIHSCYHHCLFPVAIAYADYYGHY